MINLKQRSEFIKTLFQPLLSNILKQLIKFTGKMLIIIALGNLLLPKHIGTIAMVYIFIRLFDVIRVTCLSQAFIPRSDIDDRYLSTIFYMNVFIGIAFFFVTIFFASRIARFFFVPILSNVLRVSSLKFIIDSGINIKSIVSIRRLDSKKAAIQNLGGIFAYASVLLTLVILKYGIWSFVWAILSSSLVTALLSWIVTPWMPKIYFDLRVLKALFSFDIKTKVVTIISYLRENVDNFIIAKYLGTVALGYYFFASNIVLFFTPDIFSPLNNLHVSILDGTEYRDIRRIRRFFLKDVVSSIALSFLICSGISVLGYKFIMLFFRLNWLSALAPLRILCILGILKSLLSIIIVKLYFKGKSNLILNWLIFCLFTNIIASLFGIPYDVKGVATAITINEFICFLIIISIAILTINFKLGAYLQKLYPIFASSLILSLFLIISSIFLVSNTFSFISIIIAGAAIYFILLKRMDKRVLGHA